VEPLHVLVVSADPLARGGLAALVAQRSELVLAGEASPRDLAGAAARAAPAVVLWDVGAGGAEGVRASPAPVVALAADERQAADALRAGARGALFRGAAAEVVAAALVSAARGLTVLDPDLAGEFVRPPAAAPHEPLTPREREVLALLAEGLPNKGIAARLAISEHTAKFHVNAILGKLGVESRAEAIVQAARTGLVVL
jgi:two-component system, NarL family, nitrate/nitrite response regulator NarL